MSPKVRQGSLDAAFVAVPPGGLDPGFGHRVLVRDEIVAVVAADRPQARRPDLTLPEPAGTPLITYGPDSGLRHPSRGPRVTAVPPSPRAPRPDGRADLYAVLAAADVAVPVGPARRVAPGGPQARVSRSAPARRGRSRP
ncbi:LysR family transcriptional regulator substrate-binding protein [Streptomyces sp. NPDC051016]|uniref:LysR family transcriptional regulator substrate-binding protein n=1 Tax=Streptomyces sp. NPDC051016 TaxID=3365638 RepID=UPI0037952B29